MESLFLVGVIILFGMIIGLVVDHFKIPSITGYIIAGIIIGPSFLGILPSMRVEGLQFISEIAIGFLAFLIGTEIWFPKIKKFGFKIILITIIESISTFVIVFLGLYFLLGLDIFVSLIIAAISAATSGEPIIMLTKQYKCKGELTDTVLPIVALDDVVGVVIFSISITIANTYYSGDGASLSIVELFKEPLTELLVSLLVGGIIGLILGILINLLNKSKINHNIEALYLEATIVAIFLSVSLATFLNASEVLLPLTVGVVFTNLIPKDTFKRETEVVERFMPPMIIIFFALAGASLDVSALASLGIIGLIAISLRIVGKYVGTIIGAAVTRSSRHVRRYLWLLLSPQGGVAIGLAIAASKTSMPEQYANQIQSITLASTAVYAILGPIFVKYGLTKAAEVSDTN